MFRVLFAQPLMDQKSEEGRVLVEKVQGAWYMTVFFWYLVKRDLSSARQCTKAYTSVTFHKIPEQHGHVYLVGL